MKLLIIIIIVIVMVLLIGFAVSKTPKSNSEVAENFLDQLNSIPKSHEVKDPVKLFEKLFADFKVGANEDVIRQIYAKNLYFNDTFREISTIDELIPYMITTAEMTSSTTVEILDVAFSGSDYYIRWVMEMNFTAKNKDIYSKSIGMTQLRFDDNGQIIFHQDYWDSTEGFYQHLPYIGYFIRKIKSKL